MAYSARNIQSAFAIGACLLALTACSSGSGDGSGAATSMSDSAGMEGMGSTMAMEGKGEMQGMSGVEGMSTEMQSHMGTMMAADGAGMKTMLAEHRQLVTNMLATMNSEMSGMQMTADAQWTATMDSLRQDLVHMSEMDASALKAAMPGHDARVRRMAAMHATMMKGMR